MATLCDFRACHDTEQFYHLESSCTQLPSQAAPGSNCCSDFYHHVLVLSALELHVNGSTQYVLLCV